jgi:hypothetical protein
LRHRDERQDEVVAEALQVEALFAGQDRLLGGAFEQPEVPRRDAARQRVNARADLGALEVGRRTQGRMAARLLNSLAKA